jgi:ABC-type phosphate/phosphonate transport system substrate-binding protein
MVQKEQGGVEYAILRESDNMMLEDREGDGTDVLWTDDEDNATWYDTEAMARAGASTNGLTEDADGDTLVEGYRVISRLWYYDDDLEDDATEA